MKHNKSNPKGLVTFSSLPVFLTYSNPRLCLQKIDKTIQTKIIKKKHPQKTQSQNLRQFGMDDTPFPAQILLFITGVLEQQISRERHHNTLIQNMFVI